MRLLGTWQLTPVLRAVTIARGIPLDLVDGAGNCGAALLWHQGGTQRRLVLPGLDESRRAVVRHAVGVLAGALRPLPDKMTGVVLTPAGGVCGPARHGPVDAIRDAGPISFTVGAAQAGEALSGREHVVRAAPGTPTPDTRPVPVALRMLDVQQTRCWLLVVDCHAADGSAVTVHPQAGIVRLPPPAARDTARAIEYLQDSGLDPDWPGLALLGAPHSAAPGVTQLSCLFTEAAYVADLLDTLTGLAQRADSACG